MSEPGDRTDDPTEDAAQELDRTSDAVVSLDEDWRVTAWNGQMAELSGVSAAEAVGTEVWTVFDGYDLSESSFASALRETAETGGERAIEATLPGVDARVEVRIYPDPTGVTAYLTPSMSRLPHDRELERSREVLRALHDSVIVLDSDLVVEFALVHLDGADDLEGRGVEEAMTSLTSPADAKRFLAAARAVLDGDSLDGDSAASEGGSTRRRAGATAGGATGGATDAGSGTAEGGSRRLTLPYGSDEDLQYVDHRLTRVTFDGEDHVLVIGRDVTERTRFERRLRALQSIARELNTATNADDIASRAVSAAADVIDMPLTGVWLVDESGDALVPAAVTVSSDAMFDDHPTFRGGESLAWEAFEADEFRRIDDMDDENERHNPDTVVRSELIAPLGDHGVMLTASLEPNGFDDADVDLFRALAASVEATLARTDREQRLEERNRQLERFADVVAHDIRNPLGVAAGHLDLARESGDTSHLDRVDGALDRIERLVDELLELARNETGDADTESVDLPAVAREAWATVETDEATLTVADGLGRMDWNEGQLTQLFENCYRNAIEHAGPDVAVTVGPLDGGGFYVADDGPGVPEDVRDHVFDHGFTTDREGTGFGLAIVAEVAEAHGFEASATESDAGGARFEFRPV
ncbi:ATP-binding protein [Halobaculum sp. CBA1158]|uniref:ATP-binding protein n=1 Tax=Halobaculum sp. CBA1158 TaxID=2904243 RepID=UPI001F3AC9EA|nr:ATP-binding protein [Halobaculum sp. CBA1158]UIO99021.1 ATP-binding protein [Halobaculum sp. CBA1158]